jgi:hypothetical protein
MTSLDFLRKDALETLLKGFPGSKKVFWSTKQAAHLTDHVMSVSESVAAEPARKEALRSTSNIVTRAIEGSDLNFLWVISRKVVDLVGDVVENVDTTLYANNNPVLAFHDSTSLPVATGSLPYRSGIDLMSVVKFPQPGTSAASDEMAAAVRAGLIKGASIAFRPRRYTFSKDPSRPLGIDFHEVELVEWSLTPSPCCPGCLMVGPVNAKSIDQHAIAARQHEVRSMVSLAKGPSRAPTSREARIAEAQKLRRLVEARR